MPYSGTSPSDNTGGCVSRVVGWASWHGHSICLTSKPDYIAALSLIKPASCPRACQSDPHLSRSWCWHCCTAILSGFGMGCPRGYLKTAPTIAHLLVLACFAQTLLFHRPITNIIFYSYHLKHIPLNTSARPCYDGGQHTCILELVANPNSPLSASSQRCWLRKQKEAA
jgi:hypothetical protein